MGGEKEEPVLDGTHLNLTTVFRGRITEKQSEHVISLQSL